MSTHTRQALVGAYETLGLSLSSSPGEVRAAYLRAAKALHPDVGGSPAAYRAIKAAYDLIQEVGPIKTPSSFTPTVWPTI